MSKKMEELKKKLNFYRHLDNIGDFYVPLTLICFFISFVFCVFFVYTDDFSFLLLSTAFLLIEWILILKGVDKIKRCVRYYGYN